MQAGCRFASSPPGSRHPAGPDGSGAAGWPGAAILLRRAGHQPVTAQDDPLGQVMARVVLAALWPRG